MKELPGDVFVTGQLTPDTLRALAEQGVQSFISNRPDGEAPGMAMSDELEAVAKEVGAAFAYLPMAGMLSPDLLAANAESFATLPRPIVAYCASGMRSAALWGFAHVGSLGVDGVMRALEAAGYPLPQLRPQLEAYLLRSEG